MDRAVAVHEHEWSTRSPSSPSPAKAGGGRVLIIDDDTDLRELTAEAVGERGFEVVTCGSAEQGLVVLDQQDVDVVVTDVRLNGTDGLDLCQQVTTRWPEIPVVVITGYPSMQTAVKALRAGACDLVTKPYNFDSLASRLHDAARHHQLAVDIRRAQEAVPPATSGAIIGESPAMQKLFSMMDRLRDTDAPLLIVGESGTGKELVARALHDKGPQRDGPFVAINCAAVPSTLLESTLFGHVRGAFTDAKQSQRGLFLEANGGTLLLDEIGEMPLEMQSKLLRVLQERKVRPVGGAQEQEFDTRIMTATNRDLDEQIERRAFRRDLYYRINVVRLDVPPLRERGDDILLLARHFLSVAASRTGRPVRGITPEAARRMVAHDWPGNVRELQNAIERAVALTRHDQIRPDDLPAMIHHCPRPVEPTTVEVDELEAMPPLYELERRYVERVLALAEGNKTKAARVLGVDRRTLYRKLERWEDHPLPDRPMPALAGGPPSSRSGAAQAVGGGNGTKQDPSGTGPSSQR